MSNKIATFGVSLSYSGPQDETETAPNVTVLVPYQGQNVAAIDVPNATAGATSFPVPFGLVTNATGVLLINRTGQDMKVKTNTAGDYRLPSGGVTLIAAPAAAGGTPLTAVAVLTTGTQSGAGTVAAYVFGDPT